MSRVLSIISRGVHDNSHETELLIISSDLSKSRLGQEWMKKSLRRREGERERELTLERERSGGAKMAEGKALPSHGGIVVNR